MANDSGSEDDPEKAALKKRVAELEDQLVAMDAELEKGRPVKFVPSPWPGGPVITPVALPSQPIALPTLPTYPEPSTWWGDDNRNLWSSQPSYPPCMIAEYFRNNPHASSCLISCSCPRCSVYCSTTTPAHPYRRGT